MPPYEVNQMPIRVVVICNENVAPPAYYRHLQRLPKRKRAEFIRRTSWSGFDREQDNERSSADSQGPSDKAPSDAPRIDQELEDEIRAVWLKEED